MICLQWRKWVREDGSHQSDPTLPDSHPSQAQRDATGSSVILINPRLVNYKQIFRLTPLSLFLVPTVYRQIEVRHSMALWSCWLEVARVTCIYVKDPGSHAPIGVLWQCQNGAQRQLFTFWQIHADLHGGVSQTFQLPNVDLIFFPTFLARSGFLDGEKNTRTTFST